MGKNWFRLAIIKLIGRGIILNNIEILKGMILPIILVFGLKFEKIAYKTLITNVNYRFFTFNRLYNEIIA